MRKTDNLFDTGIRPSVDDYLLQESKKVRDYGKYWSASSAGYCMRKLILERLGVPPVKDDPRKQRVFSSGHIFHEWLQRLTAFSGVSVAQEVELIDDSIMVKGHFDDLVRVHGRLILYDFKTQNSRAFTYQKANPQGMSHFHRMQLGTYMYMLRKTGLLATPDLDMIDVSGLQEARILKISKDDLRMSEQRLLWSDELEGDVLQFWNTLNHFWNDRKIPACNCAKYEGGFMAKEAYNPYYYGGEPCSLNWYALCVKEGNLISKGKKK